MTITRAGRFWRVPASLLAGLFSLGLVLTLTVTPSVFTVDDHTRLNLERAGLVVSDDDARTYEALVEEIHRRAAGGAIYAGPDCPEVYFLSGFLNPARAIFDVLGQDPGDAAWMTSLLDRSGVVAVVINTQPNVSPRLSRDVEAVLERRFSASRQIGTFIVRW